ncbi:MAG: hypothetical protein A2511_04590 [Deltaproteobacteria bacterium RIFOXYD12_FULL_50_9]|nr:MAG: hypothetical protein A2511_04590 [Deltaproteobacteria bacterium RIFOXYD12_FULL_50_9]
MKSIIDFPEALSRAMVDFSAEETDTGLTVIGMFIFSPDSEVFIGHFPGEPILPAVVQLTLVRLLTSRALGKGVLPAGVSRIKFSQVVKPDEPLQLIVKLTRQAISWSAAFNLNHQAKAVASGTIKFDEV